MLLVIAGFTGMILSVSLETIYRIIKILMVTLSLSCFFFGVGFSELKLHKQEVLKQTTQPKEQKDNGHGQGSPNEGGQH